MDRKELKAQAKQQIGGGFRWLLLFLIYFLCFVLCSAIWTVCVFIPLISLVAVAISAVLLLLCTTITLQMVDKKPLRAVGQSFSTSFRVDNIKRSFFAWCRLVSFTYLWALLLIVPGIVKAIAYSQTFFLLADNKNMTAAQAQAKSLALMDGRKWEYGKLILSFSGWILLGVFLFVILACLGLILPGILAFSLLCAWAIPYIQVTLANFYRGLASEKREVVAAKKKRTAVSTPCPLCGKEPSSIFGVSAVRLNTWERLCSDCAGDLAKAIPGKFSYRQYSVKEAKAAIKKYKEEEPAREAARQAALQAQLNQAPTVMAGSVPRRARCPSCRSVNIEPVGRKHKSYSFKKAAVGTALFGVAGGALVGFTGGTGKHEFYCRDCGKIFKRRG